MPFTDTGKEENRGLIFDIKRFSVNDGPGIRTTVFFKGCPLHCPWCHNPESFEIRPQVVFDGRRCISSQHSCTAYCPKGAITREPLFYVDHAACDGCGICVDHCPSEALRMIGRWMTVSELKEEIQKDGIFFDSSQGGVTFSGGEPLMQAKFLKEILSLCKKRQIHTALDTSGYASFGTVAALIDNVDLFLYDIKFIDDEKHVRFAGVSNIEILANLKRIVSSNKPVIIRIPLIPGITDTDENITDIAAFLRTLPYLPPVSLLNFHRGGEQKYRRLGLDYSMSELQPLPDEKISHINEIFAENHFIVTIGE